MSSPRINHCNTWTNKVPVSGYTSLRASYRKQMWRVTRAGAAVKRILTYHDAVIAFSFSKGISSP
jgi:hypothetical protein